MKPHSNLHPKERNLKSFFQSIKKRVAPAKRKWSESVSSNNEATVNPCPKMVNPRRGENVTWTRENEGHFIVLCHKEWKSGTLLTTSFIKPVLGQICDRLNSLVHGSTLYTVDHLKTKWKSIKRAWKLLYGLRFNRGSGLGWDPERETIVGEPDQLDAIYAEHTENKSIIKRGLSYFEMCTKMFMNKIATGNDARSSRQTFNEDDMMPPPPCDDTPGASHSAYNFIPTENAPSSSRSSSRKRTANFDNETVVNAIANINSYFEGKKSRIDHEREEFANYLAIVRAMEIPLRLKIKTGEHLGLASTREFFLNSDEYTRLEWISTLD
ncbi:hypothetical protein ACS0TY_031483 [Phlomoides rotata]